MAKQIYIHLYPCFGQVKIHFHIRFDFSWCGSEWWIYKKITFLRQKKEIESDVLLEKGVKEGEQLDQNVWIISLGKLRLVFLESAGNLQAEAVHEEVPGTK